MGRVFIGEASFLALLHVPQAPERSLEPTSTIKFNLLNVYLSQSTTPVIKSNMESGPAPLKRR